MDKEIWRSMIQKSLTKSTQKPKSQTDKEIKRPVIPKSQTDKEIRRPVIPKSSTKSTQKPKLIRLLRDSEVNGSIKRSNVVKVTPRRYYALDQIVPCSDVLSHIFLGFTRDGQHLLSYCFKDDEMFFYVWHFNHHSPLKLVSQHEFLISKNNSETSLFQTESMAIYVYQWPHDDKHLLILTIPERQQHTVINLFCIHINQERSHILQHKPIRFPVINWEYKLSSTYWQDDVNFKEFLTPGLLLFGPSVCTFHTGTEIVYLELKDLKNKGECCEVTHSVLDVEFLAETLDKKYSNHFTAGLSNYELLVYEINTKPSKVYAYVLAIYSEDDDKSSALEFDIIWNPVKGNYEVKRCGSIERFNVLNETSAQKILIDSLKSREIYSLNNVQLIENLSSFSSINSPADNVSVILSVV